MQKITKKKKIFYILIFIIIVFCIALYFYNKSTQKTLARCPDDYTDDDAGSAEYLADFDKWTNEFYDNNPDASLSDWSEARYQFWVDNKCTKAIERYNEVKE